MYTHPELEAGQQHLTRFLRMCIHVLCGFLSWSCMDNFLSRHRSAETQCWMRRYVRGTYVRGTYVAFRNAPAQVLHTLLIGCQTYL